MNGLGLVQLIQWGSQLKGFKSKAGTSSPEEKEVLVCRLQLHPVLENSNVPFLTTCPKDSALVSPIIA